MRHLEPGKAGGVDINPGKHDRPVARLVPAVSNRSEQRQKATAGLRDLRAHYTLKGVSARALIDQGRR